MSRWSPMSLLWAFGGLRKSGSLRAVCSVSLCLLRFVSEESFFCPLDLRRSLFCPLVFREEIFEQSPRELRWFSDWFPEVYRLQIVVSHEECLGKSFHRNQFSSTIFEFNFSNKYQSSAFLSLNYSSTFSLYLYIHFCVKLLRHWIPSLSLKSVFIRFTIYIWITCFVSYFVSGFDCLWKLPHFFKPLRIFRYFIHFFVIWNW